MARRAETTSLTGKHQQTLFPTVRAPDAGKPAHRIAAVEILLDNILDDGPEILGIYSIIGAKMGLRTREYFDVGLDELLVVSYAGSQPPLTKFLIIIYHFL